MLPLSVSLLAHLRKYSRRDKICILQEAKMLLISEQIQTYFGNGLSYLGCPDINASGINTTIDPNKFSKNIFSGL